MKVTLEQALAQVKACEEHAKRQLEERRKAKYEADMKLWLEEREIRRGRLVLRTPESNRETGVQIPASPPIR